MARHESPRDPRLHGCDDSENGLGWTSIGPGTRELEIASSCTSINAR
jgi:hypothetical protein